MKDADNNVPFGETLPVHYNALAGLTVEETEIRAYGKLSAEELNSYLEMTKKADGSAARGDGKTLKRAEMNQKKTKFSYPIILHTGAVYFPTVPFLFVRKNL